ncbi:ABC transporter permease [Arthrobacter mangrovi]|uniref:Exporter of polyketide antibiotics n=1 Tax=Arthrobacter mangrovi TaxID=2966350 RepID=A0ABQ5N0I9_9MICC|nr:polyketide antibiotic transporter [Arthrobacter mangrovi]GLB69572.1 exporter of polyketide antibiotics [Arthrobacter mangrovi]
MKAVLRLVLAQVRRDRWQLAVWIAGIALLGFATAAAVAAQFGDESARAAIIAVAAANPAFLFLRGIPDGTGLGSVVFFQGYAFTAVLAGLMNTFLVIRHTRGDEEAGRAELLGAGPLSRAVPLAATLILASAANTVLAACVAAGYVLAGLPGSGSVVAGLAVGAVGLFFAAVAAGTAQLLPSARAANGAAAALVGAAYLVRGIGDAMGTPSPALDAVASGWPSMLSPIGWGQRSRPFAAAGIGPVLVLAAAAAVLAAVAVLYRQRRDLGESVLPEHPGPARASAAGRTLTGLAWRLQRSTLAGWFAAAAVLGSVAGAFGPVVAREVEGNPSLTDLISRLVPGTEVGVVDVFGAALMGIAGVLAAAAGVQAVLRLRAEESEGRAELLLAGSVSPARWMGASLTVAALSTTVVCAAAGTAAAVCLALTGSPPAGAAVFLAAGLAHAPAALVFLAAAALIFAVVPRHTVQLGWGLLAAGLVLGQFGELLRLPAWLQNVSPFRYSSALPVEDLNVTAAGILLSVAAAGALAAARLLHKRDLTP